MAADMAPLLSDSLIAQLLDMGFEQESINACEAAMNSSGSPITLQSATEWILQHRGPQSLPRNQPIQPTLRLGGGGGNIRDEAPKVMDAFVNAEGGGASTINRPMSSGSALDYSIPLKSRYDLSDEKRRQKEQFQMKERDDALKRAREKKLDDIRAKATVMQKIEEDRQRRANKATAGTSKPLPSPTAPVAAPLGPPPATASSTKQCRVQVRLPNGSVLRQSFSPESSLNDVCKFVSETHPRLLNVQLVQPFPHKEFTLEEHAQSLSSLGLCPSASLVVSKKPTEASLNPPSLNTPPPLLNAPPPSLDPPQGGDVDMEEEEEDMEEEDNPVNIMPHPHPVGVPGRLPPHPGGFPGRLPPHPGMFPPGRGGIPFPIQQGSGVAFEGEGHRLGGKEAPMKFGDPQSMSRYVTDTARSAAEMRAQTISKFSIAPGAKSRVSPTVPSLEVLCIRMLEGWSSVDLLPNCSHLPPRTAHRLLTSLAKAKQLHPKTLNMFIKCPIQKLVLDNYSYATNQLLDMVRYFPSLTHLSLVSCNLITDKSLMQLLSYLPNLSFLNLNECHQISDDSFQNFKSFNSISVLRLAFIKLSDVGLMYFLRFPLPSLQELDVSFTRVSSNGIARLGKQAPDLRVLNIESTTVLDLSPLLSFRQLQSLNVSRCPIERNIGPLASCSALSSLNLSHVPVDSQQLELLAGLRLSSFLLPERSEFFDQHMITVSNFPLTSLDLTGYRNITDVGISCIRRMNCLVQLFLGRTRLTDEGLAHLKDLDNLKQLSLDNTDITDAGMVSISGLMCLEELSVSDTRLTSQFIIDGALARLHRLQKLNLVRTYVDDSGLLSLNLPSLLMLNIDWTCASEKVTIETMREDAGCKRLETLRNKNIGQAMPSSAAAAQGGDNNEDEL